MPYIELEDRENFEAGLDRIITDLDTRTWSAGDVNYVIYSIFLAWWKSAPKYVTICKIIGTLGCVTQEFYRKFAAPYEEIAERRNGEIT